jgi:hypothetical protein
MRISVVTLAVLALLGLGLAASADDAAAAPIGASRVSVMPDVYVGFGYGCGPSYPRPYYVRRSYYAPYAYGYSYGYAPYSYGYGYAPYAYRPYYYRPRYSGATIGFGYHSGYRHYGRQYGGGRYVGRRR